MNPFTFKFFTLITHCSQISLNPPHTSGRQAPQSPLHILRFREMKSLSRVTQHLVLEPRSPDCIFHELSITSMFFILSKFIQQIFIEQLQGKYQALCLSLVCSRKVMILALKELSVLAQEGDRPSPPPLSTLGSAFLCAWGEKGRSILCSSPFSLFTSSHS